MAKLTLLFVCLTLGLFGTIKSASFECEFKTGGWSTLGSVYWRNVQNTVTITSTDAAQIDSISGTHQAGYNNDNVEAINVWDKGQIHYFPRGLDKIFKNLKGIQISSTELKEIHQSDLIVFPNLKNLYLVSNDLEIFEENLFEFNPNLDFIDLNSNKISHIDSNVFDKLTKLKTLSLQENICINMIAYKNPTAVQNIIRIVKSQCTNSDYSKLEQKFKNLEAESKILNSENFKKKLENLQNKVKNSNFSNFFQDKLEDLKAIKIEKAQKEVPDKIDKVDEKLTAMSKEISSLKNENVQNFVRIQNLAEDQSQKIATVESKLSTIDGKLVDVKAGVQKNNQKIEELSQQITKVNEAASKNNNNTTTSKDIETSNSQSLAAIMNFIENLSKKMEAIEVKLAEMDIIQKEKQDQTMEKISKMKLDMYDNKVEMNEKFNAILSRI